MRFAACIGFTAIETSQQAEACLRSGKIPKLRDASRTLWPLVDNLGSVRDLAKQDGTIAVHYTYDTYGSGDTSLTRYLFTSRELDTATDLQYNRARWYDAGVGRWLSEDPLGFDQSSHNFSANCSFAWNYDIKAQYCWAHLIRDMRFLLELPDKKTRDWAEQLLDRSRRLFSAWHNRDEMSTIGFERSMKLHRDRFLEIMRNVPDSKDAANLAARFAVVELTDGSTYDMSQDYFRFLLRDGVEPTNNHSEQQIRHVVIDRRITQGTRSEAGQRYHERMWTVVATCNKQSKNFFKCLHSSIKANLAGLPAPSLLA